MELKLAQDIAVKLCVFLNPFCERINIAGSVRRKKTQVKDIEIVALPKTNSVTANTLFGESTTTHHACLEFVEAVASMGKIIKGSATGRYCQIELPEGIMLDLFIPTSSDYIRQYVIRTGSAEYVRNKIAHGWRKKGWVGTENGLRPQSECTEKKVGGKSVWTCISTERTLPPVFQTEEEFFTWLGIKMPKPQDRHF